MSEAHSSARRATLFVLVPALNEEATVAAVVRGALALATPELAVRVAVVNDGSTDRTAAVAAAAGADVITFPVNQGLGKVLRTGLAHALSGGADLVVNIDGDGQFDPADIRQLIAPLLAGEADFVTASRFADPALVPVMPRAKLWGNHMMSRLVSFLIGRRYYDVSCGFRAYSRECALRLNLWGAFTYTQESFLDLAVKGMRIREVPVRVLGVRPVGTSRMASNLWVYAWRTSKIILRSYRDYWPLPFFSLLSLPWLLAGASLLVFFFGHYLARGQFRPHLWAGFSGGSLVAFGLGLIGVGVFADMLKRIRLNQEELLYLARCREYGGSSGAAGAGRDRATG